VTLGVVAAACAQTANPPLPPAVYSRQNVFPIPFRIEGGSAAAKGEVQLYLSEDRGATWQIAGRAPLTGTQFNFRANRDGEHWFMVRTLDSMGVLRPDGPAAPELRVVIDTAQPEINLETTRGQDGEIRARWRITDANLKPQTFKVSHQIRGAGDSWHDAAVDPLKQEPSGNSWSGEAAWWPDDTTKTLTVRIEVSDLAGNRATTQSLVEPPFKPAESIAQSTLPPPSENRAAQPKPHATPWPAQESNRTPSHDAGEPVGLPQMSETFPGSTADAKSRGPVARRASDNGERTRPSNWSPNRTEEVLPSPPGWPNDLQERTDRPVSDTVTKPAVTEEHPIETVPSEKRPPQDELKLSPANDTDHGPTAFDGQMLPRGVRPRMVNRRRFEMEYDVSSIGPEGIGKIELWGTRDGGRTWNLFQVDNDNRSPIVVNVNAEGLYGFRMVVETSTGLRGTPPGSGDLPEVWVGVDTNKPQAKLWIADAPTAVRPCELSIRWNADDEMLAARPVSLSFSDSPTGPWSTIAAGLENTGRYDWRLDNRVPDSIYVRLEVRDEAGNSLVVDTPEAVSVARIRPQGRILNVRPVGDAARKLGPTSTLR
jgi:hypothetical protein